MKLDEEEKKAKTTCCFPGNPVLLLNSPSLGPFKAMSLEPNSLSSNRGSTTFKLYNLDKFLNLLLSQFPYPRIRTLIPISQDDWEIK